MPPKPWTNVDARKENARRTVSIICNEQNVSHFFRLRRPRKRGRSTRRKRRRRKRGARVVTRKTMTRDLMMRRTWTCCCWKRWATTSVRWNRTKQRRKKKEMPTWSRLLEAAEAVSTMTAAPKLRRRGWGKTATGNSRCREGLVVHHHDGGEVGRRRVNGIVKAMISDLYRGLSTKKRRLKRPKVWDVWNINSEFGTFHNVAKHPKLLQWPKLWDVLNAFLPSAQP